MVRRRSRYCDSASAAGSASGAGRRMLVGIASSISASSEATPIVRSIARVSSGRGPMWRGAKKSVASRFILLHEIAVLVGRQQLGGFPRVRRFDFDQPGTVRFAVDLLGMRG